MKIKLPKLKRWQKMIRNFSICFALLFLGLFSVEFRTVSSKATFKKLADSFLIEDYNIIGTVKDSGDTMLKKEKKYIAETTDYYLIGQVYQEKLFWHAYTMLYEYRKSEITLFPVPFLNDFDPFYVDLIMFTENKEAVSAKLIVNCTLYSEVETESNNPIFDEQYISVAEKGKDGYFSFTISGKHTEYKTYKYYEERTFFRDIMNCRDLIWGQENEVVTMVVELYNAKGECIASEQKGRPAFD